MLKRCSTRCDRSAVRIMRMGGPVVVADNTTRAMRAKRARRSRGSGGGRRASRAKKAREGNEARRLVDRSFFHRNPKPL
jgi:hypothetical protein